MKRTSVFALLVALFLTIAWLVVASGLWGFPSLGRLVILTIIGWLIASVVVLAARSLSYTIWIYAGVVILVLLSLPDAVIGDITAHLPHPLEAPTTFEFLLAIPSAILVAGLLSYSGLNLHLTRQVATPEDDRFPQGWRKRPATASVVALFLSVLVLVAALLTSYRLLVWDTTDDSLGMVWLAIPILSVLCSSSLLLSLLPGKAKLAGLSNLLLIPLLIVIAGRAQTVDFRHLTEVNAERVRQGIEAYFVGQGGYPQNLGQLVPRYALSLPGPVIIYGQSWCYQAGQDYYRLGYLDREHWSSPILFGRVYSARGHSPLRVDVCQAAIGAYRVQHPDWDRTLQDYGKPTPTADIRE